MPWYLRIRSHQRLSIQRRTIIGHWDGKRLGAATGLWAACTLLKIWCVAEDISARTV